MSDFALIAAESVRGPSDGCRGGEDLTGAAEATDGRSPQFRALCEVAVRTLPVSGASLVLMSSSGHRSVIAASDETAARLDELQFTLGEGPAIDAFREGHPVLVRDLSDPATANRWPAFARVGHGVGARAVFALPLQIGAIGLGVFVLHSAEPGVLSEEGLAQALRLTDTAAYAMLDLVVPAAPAVELNGAGSGADHDGDRDPGAPFFLGAEVHQASGILMIQLGVPIEVALARLRAHAFAEDRSLADVARDVVARGLLLER